MRISATANRPLTEFKNILDTDPNNLSAIDGIGSILYNMGGTPFDAKKLEDSKTYHEKHIALKPDDPEPYYWVGVIDWSLAYRANKDMRDKYNHTAKKPIKESDPDAAGAGHAVRRRNMVTTVDEGIEQPPEGHPEEVRITTTPWPT